MYAEYDKKHQYPFTENTTGTKINKISKKIWALTISKYVQNKVHEDEIKKNARTHNVELIIKPDKEITLEKYSN